MLNTLIRILLRERFGPQSATQIFLQELENLQKDGGAFLNVEHHPQTLRIHCIFLGIQGLDTILERESRIAIF